MIRGSIHRFLARLLAPLAAIVVAWFAMTGIVAAAVEVNSADQSQLESVKGIGPALSAKILTARKQAAFKDWSDLQARVSGVGEKNSAALSRNGLTVGGRAKEGEPAGADTGRGAKASSSKKADSSTTIASTGKKSS